MRAAMLLGTALVLAGCASSTMHQARQGDPDKTFTSAKAEPMVAECIQFGWQDEAVFGVDASGYLDVGPNGGATVSTRGAEYFADVRAEAGGTVVKFYAVKDDALAQRRMAALATCL